MSTVCLDLMEGWRGLSSTELRQWFVMLCEVSNRGILLKNVNGIYRSEMEELKKSFVSFQISTLLLTGANGIVQQKWWWWD